MTKEEKVIQDLYKKKVELSVYNVELALIDDVKKAYADAINARKKTQDVYDVVKKQVQASIKQLQDLKATNEKFLPIVQKFKDAAKGLGIDVPKDILDQEKNIQDGLKGLLAIYTKKLQDIKF